MRLFGVIILAAILSCFTGLIVTLALDYVIACRSDPAGCGMGQAYRLVFVLVGAVLAMIVFAAVMLFRGRVRAAGIAAIVLAALAFATIILGVVSDLSSGRTTKLDDILELVQVILPFCAVVATQWFVLKAYLNRRAIVAEGRRA